MFAKESVKKVFNSRAPMTVYAAYSFCNHLIHFLALKKIMEVKKIKNLIENKTEVTVR